MARDKEQLRLDMLAALDDGDRWLKKAGVGTSHELRASDATVAQAYYAKAQALATMLGLDYRLIA
jgi:hypothetical protein